MIHVLCLVKGCKSLCYNKCMTVTEAWSLISSQFSSELLPKILYILVLVSPIFLAFALFVIAWNLWVTYVRAKNFLSIKYTLLELKLPQETTKSPLAMESFLHALHNTADGSKIGQFWKGETRPWYSLELISLGGQIKFMIWTEDRRKAGLIAALYSQFPSIEIHEREDYAKSVHFDPATMKLNAIDFALNKEDPYPIKTYVDYGLNKDPKEEFKVDPLVPLIEFLGSVPPNYQIWFQFIIRAHTKDEKKKGQWLSFDKQDSWKLSIEALKNKIMIRDPKTKVTGEKTKDDKPPRPPTLSEGEKDIVSALDRRLTKLPFDVGIRSIYLGPKDNYDAGFGVGGMIASMKQFNSENMNGFKQNSKKWHFTLGNVWFDYKKIRSNLISSNALAAYKRRSYFFAPFESTPIILNTEELATIYHFPGSTAATPGLQRIPSKKGMAPSNLPI